MRSLQYLLLFILAVFFFGACESDECPLDPTFEYSWIQNQSIEITPSDTLMQGDSLLEIFNYNVIDGQAKVFEYIYTIVIHAKAIVL